MLIDPFYTAFRISLSHYIQIDVGKICINHSFPLLPKITKYIKLFSFVWNIPVLEKLWIGEDTTAAKCIDVVMPLL